MGWGAPLTKAEAEQIVPLGADNIQQVSGLERATAMNLTKNPDQAEAYLKKIGYQVRRDGPGWSFATRRSNGEMWHPVDPDGLDTQDIFDFLGDLFVGAVSTVGMIKGGLLGTAVAGPGPGTIAGGIVGSGVGNAAGEAMRQGIGSLAGVPENFGGAEIATAGLVGAALPAAGKLAGKTLQAAGGIALSTAAKLSGIKGTATLSGKEMLLEAAGKKWGTLKTPADAARRFKTLVQWTDRKMIRQSQANKAMLETLPGTVTGDIRDVAEGLIRHTRVITGHTRAGRPIRHPKMVVAQRRSPLMGNVATKEAAMTGKEKGLAANVEDVVLSVQNLIGSTPSRSVPMAMLNQVKELFAERARFDSVAQTGQRFREVMRGAEVQTRTILENGVTAAGHPEYVPMMRQNARWMDMLNVFKKKIDTDEAAERYVGEVYGSGLAASVQAIRDFEEEFGVSMLAAMREATTAANVTGAGRGVGGYLLSTGRPGAGASMLAMASPRLQVGAVRGILKSADFAGSVGRAGVGPVTVGRTGQSVAAAAATRVANDFMREHVQRQGVREDAPKKKPKVVVGGGY